MQNNKDEFKNLDTFKMLKYFSFSFNDDAPDNFSSKVKNFNSADDGESSEEPHGASNC